MSFLTVKQTITTVNPGDSACEHTFVNKNRGKFSVRHLSHEQEKICFHCGCYRKVRSEIIWENPFSFEAVMAKHNKAAS